MGYYINSMEANFILKKENIQKAWEAIKNLLKEKKQIGWTSWEVIKDCHSFEEVMIACGWEIYANQEGDYNNIVFINEKAGKQEIILNIIAPYILDKSYIQMQGDNEEIWRWVFENSKVRTVYPIILWNYHNG